MHCDSPDPPCASGWLRSQRSGWWHPWPYRTGFAELGYDAAPKPSWPTGDATSLTDARRINDFIQAGYTGGGRGFSVQTAEEIRSVFDSVLSDILNAAGSDAGIEMESPESGVSTLDGSLKYGVEFRTVDNSGDVKATLLDANGNGLKQDKDINGNLLLPASANYWTASKQVQDHTERRIFSMGFGITPFEFKGSFADLPAMCKWPSRPGKIKSVFRTTAVSLTICVAKIPYQMLSPACFALVCPPSVQS